MRAKMRVKMRNGRRPEEDIESLKGIKVKQRPGGQGKVRYLSI